MNKVLIIIAVAMLSCGMATYAQTPEELEIQTEVERRFAEYMAKKTQVNENGETNTAMLSLQKAISTNPTNITTLGHKYKGQIKGGKMNGLGAYCWPSGDVYFGEWKDGVRTGFGIYMNLIGVVYVGQFVNNTLHGTVACYDKTGKMEYYGEYRDGNRINELPYPDSNAAAHEFEMFSGHMSGIGYIGETKDGKQHGQGIIVTDDYMWYGKRKDNLGVGLGIYIHSNGTMKTETR